MKKILFTALLFSAIIGCEKEKSFPTEPVIETVSFRIVEGVIPTGEWVFTFTDGNGDLGSDAGEDTNFFQTFHIKSPTQDTALALLGERLPKVNTSGVSKGIEGEITRFIELDQYNLRSVDTVYFSAFVIDQAGNRSQVIRTPRFTLNPTIFYGN